MVQRTMFRTFLVLLVWILLPNLASAQCPIQSQCGNLAVSGGFPAGSNTFFCEGEVVDFQNTTDPSLVDTTIIDWGDGVVEVYVGDLTYQHSYDFPADTCLSNTVALSPQIFMTVINNCGDARSVNCFSTFVQIKVEPVARFEASSIYCIDDLIAFNDLSCGNGEEVTYAWDFGGLGTSNEPNPTFAFTTPGPQTVSLTVTNECGSDTYTQTINIIEPVVIDGITADGIASPAEPLVLCLEDGGLLSLDGASQSLNETNYFWEVIQNGGYTWILPDTIPTPVLPELDILFTEEGVYDIVLRADNSCALPAFDTLTVQVLGGDLSLNAQADGCVSLDYTPDPLLDNVIYTINGVEETNFPLTLTSGSYIVEVMGASSICETGVLADTFLVLTQETAQILTPDTTICALDGAFTFTATPENGEWRINGTLFSGTLQPEDFAAGTYEITYGNEPCITSDVSSITIVNADLILPPDQELCIDDAPVTFTASPDGGFWSGIGIDSSGVFDPAIGVGTYSLYYEVINTALQSCSNLDSFQVTVADLAVDFAVVSCVGTNLCFELVDAPSFTSITWDFGGTGSSNQAAPCHTFPAAQSYDVTVTIVNGACMATLTRTITIEDPPVANYTLTYDAELCAPLAVSITNNSTGSNLVYDWQLNGVSFSDQATPAPLLLEAFAEAEMYEISLTVSNDCASDTQIETLIVQPLPLANFGTDQNTYCSGDTIPIANVSLGNPDTYQWLMDGQIIGADSLPPIVAHLTEVVDTIGICLITTNTCGADTFCLDLEIIPTDVNAFFNTAPIIVCVNDSLTITNLATPGVPVFYEFGDGNSTSNPNPTYSYAAPGTYTITQQAFGCGFDTFAKEVTVQEGPTASWDNPAFGCPGDTLVFTSTSTGVMRYTWSFGDSTAVSEEAAPRHSYQLPGIYEVCLTVYADMVGDCTHTLCQEVEIFSAPTAAFTVADSLCLGDPVVFTNTAAGDIQRCDYQFGDGNISADCDPMHTYLDPGLYVATQIVENSNLCRDTVQQQVFVRALPDPQFAMEVMNGCHPDSVRFINTSQNADSYLWDFGDNTTSELNNPTHIYTAPGTYTVTLTATVDGICSHSRSETITIDETPAAVLAVDAPSTCAGLELAFTHSSTGSFTQTEWNFGDGLFSYEAAPMHSYEIPGTYTVQLIVNNDGFCADTATVEVVVYDPLEASAVTTNIRCFGEESGAIDLSIISGTAPYSFNWSNGADTEDINALPAGTYGATITDANACTWNTSLDIDQPDALQLAVTASVVSCFGGNDGSLAIELAGGTMPYDILWETGATTTAIDNLPAGTYGLTITDGNGCVREQPITLSQNQLIELLPGIQHISCFGANDGVIAVDALTGGFPPFDIRLTGDNLTAGGVNVTRFDSLAPDVYSIALTDANGCMEDYEVEVIEPAPISINIKEDTIDLSLGEAVELVTFYNANNPTFQWSPPDRLDCTDCPNPTADPHRGRIYAVTMTDERGCTDTDEVVVRVRVNREVYIPNTFTPNGDARNDVFRIRSKYAASIATIRSFQIYDRWGGLLFSRADFPPNDRQFGWDGTAQGKAVQPGTYVYAAEIEFVDGEITILKGDILLAK